MISKASEKPVWGGPVVDGVTVSLLMKFLSCPERFRTYAIKGLEPKRFVSYPIEFGNMWHVCEEFSPNYLPHLTQYTQKQQVVYPFDKILLNTWMSVCRILFETYLSYYPSYRVSLYREQVFRVPYQLPCGRVVYLRGKIDGIDRMDNGDYCLFETKTKTSLFNEEFFQTRLSYDLQTMFYLTAIQHDESLDFDKTRLTNIVYNVIRRPSIQPKSYEDATFVQELQQKVQQEPSKYFHRYQIEIDPKQVEIFQERTLVPILTWLCNWYEMVVSIDEERIYSDPRGLHFLSPYGVLDLLEYDWGLSYLTYLQTGEDRMFDQVHTLFPELEADPIHAN